VVARAGVSKGVLDEVFGSVEDCFLAAFEEGLERLSGVVREATAREEQWLGRVRAGLVALLGFFDDEPGWGRLLVFQAPLDGAVALRAQQRLLGVLTVLMDDGSPQAIAEIMPEPQLTPELLIGGVFSVIRTRMLERDRGAFVELAPSLMSFIVGPYLGQAAADAELVGRPASAARMLSRVVESAVLLPVPFHERTALVLRAIARAPRSSNREIAEAAGLSDKGQTSHLLRRLARRGLIEKVVPRSGSRRENAWLLTPSGRRVTKLLGVGVGVGVGVGSASVAGSLTSASAKVRQAA
jgi:AcrR family transcriptional regulator